MTSDGRSSAAPGPELPRVPPERYSDFETLGKGGMGVVYLALDTHLNRRVAMKVVRLAETPDESAPGTPFAIHLPDAESQLSERVEEARARFLREATVTGGMEHPGIVPVYELGETETGVPYYTMRVVRGQRTLRDALDATNGLADRLALLEPFLKVCDTMAYAHARGVMHRDLKPENVALGEYGEAIVLDWGLAKFTTLGEAPPKDTPQAPHAGWSDRVRAEAHDALVTQMGILGTPGYLAPEVALEDEHRIDARADVYGLGAMLYELLTDRLPHPPEAMGPYLRALVHEVPVPANRVVPSTPAPLSRLADEALVVDPDARLPSARALAQRIRDWQQESEGARRAQRELDAARHALEAAEALAGSDALAAIDRGFAAVHRARDAAPHDAEIEPVEAALVARREAALGERAKAERARLLRRVALGAGVVALLVGALVAHLLNERRLEAVAARDAEARAAEEARTAERAAQAALARSLASRARRRAAALDGVEALALASASLELSPTAEGWQALGEATLLGTPSTLRYPSGVAARCLAFSRDGETLAFGGRFGDVGGWACQGGDAHSTTWQHERTVRALYAGDDGRMWSAGDDGGVRAGHLTSEQLPDRWIGPEAPLTAVLPDLVRDRVLALASGWHAVCLARHLCGAALLARDGSCHHHSAHSPTRRLGPLARRVAAPRCAPRRPRAPGAARPRRCGAGLTRLSQSRGRLRTGCATSPAAG